MKGKAAIFFDRDGTLIKDIGYAYKIEDLAILSGVIEGMKLLKDLGFIFFIVTNQSGIGRGYFAEKEMSLFNNELIRELNKEGIEIEDIKFCPHLPEENCICRKPSPFFVNLLIKEYNINTDDSFFIGDKESDILCGKNSGLLTVLVTGEPSKESDKELYNKFSGLEGMADYIVSDIEEFANILLDQQSA